MKLESELLNFKRFGAATRLLDTAGVPTYINEFWTAKQRDSHSLHEISYRACFKAELPEFFIQRLSRLGETVYDPFLGRGTTALQAALNGRVAYGCDINPLSEMLLAPRLNPPSLSEIESRLASLKLAKLKGPYRSDLEVFYHPETLKDICGLRAYFLKKSKLDSVDRWIRMVAINRLSGHSAGFFSVYTLPPNQAVSIESQKKINTDRKQKPPRRDIYALILKKSKTLLRDPLPEALTAFKAKHRLLTGDSRKTTRIAPQSVSLVVCSPPFLDVINYAGDNWLRCWFAGIDPAAVKITMAKKLEDWESVMTLVLFELFRVLKKGGHAAFEVGEVRGGKIRLEDAVLRCARKAGLKPRLVLINAQKFSKTSNIWGVKNLKKGTNTNRIVLLQK